MELAELEVQTHAGGVPHCRLMYEFGRLHFDWTDIRILINCPECCSSIYKWSDGLFRERFFHEKW